MHHSFSTLLLTFSLVFISQLLFAESSTTIKPPTKESIEETSAPVIDEKESTELSVEETLQLDYTALIKSIELIETTLKDNSKNMEGKTGEELTSSEIRQFQKGQKLIELYIKLIDNMVQQKTLTIEIAAQTQSIKHTLLNVNKRIINAINTEESNFNKQTKDLDQNHNAFFLRFKSHHEYQRTILDILVDYNVNLNKVGIQDSKSIKILHGYLNERAENLTGKIQLLSAKKKQFINNSSESGKPSKEQNILNERFNIVEASLKKVISLLVAEDLNATNYQLILIESTGTITKDVLNINVASGLVKDWSNKVKDLIQENGIDIIFKIILFSLILFITWVISKLVGGLLHRSLNRSSIHQNNLMQDMVVGLTTRFIFFLGILFALSQMGVSLGPILTGLGIAGFIIGFALQDTLGNFASGIMILIYRPYDVGDIVEVGSNVLGSVASMNLVSTTIMTFDNQTLVLPNSKIWGDVIKNITNQEKRRVDLVFHAPLSANVDKMLALYTDCIQSQDHVLQQPEPTIKLHKIGFNSLEFIIRPWVKTSNYWPVYWDLHEMIKRQYDKEGIVFPVNQNHVTINKNDN